MENLIIVGSGPAGISAALYAARAGMQPLILTQGIGALKKAEKIENFYGITPMAGAALHEQGEVQAQALGARLIRTQVLGISGMDTYTVKTTSGQYEAIAVILATGAQRTAPKIQGLKELEGKGVSYCAVCDAFFYRGRKVAVIGNGDFALHEAEELAPMAAAVTIFTNGQASEFTKDCPFAIEERPIAKISGENAVESIVLEDGTQQSVAGVFIALGTAGGTEMARQIGAQLTVDGKVEVNSDMETSIPGLYAAGDCTPGVLQVAKAAQDGMLAGLNAISYIRRYQKQ